VTQLSFPPLRGVREGEVPTSYVGGGVMSARPVAYDPTDPDYGGTSPASLGRKEEK
jgi:hypothetical protein